MGRRPGARVGPTRFEVELWSRGAEEKQNRAYDQLSAMLTSAGGRSISRCVLPEIAYHGVLVELPAESVRTMINKVQTGEHAELLRFGEVMFFRPFGQSRMPTAVPDVYRSSDPGGHREAGAVPNPGLQPIAALLDGLPLEKHRLLDGRLVIDDPDEHAGHDANQESQQHGTAMASLLCRGGVNRGESPLPRKIYVGLFSLPRHDWTVESMKSRLMIA